jgi:hypothetical protein
MKRTALGLLMAVTSCAAWAAGGDVVWTSEIIDGLNMRCAASPVAEKAIIASSEAMGYTTTVYDLKDAKGAVYALALGKPGAYEDPIGDMVAMHEPKGVVLAFAFARGFCIWQEGSLPLPASWRW